MATLDALDFPLGPSLVQAIENCVSLGRAFCVLDQRLSPRRRLEELAWLGATHVVSSTGTDIISDDVKLDDNTGLVMLTSGSSGRPKAAELSWRALEASAAITQASLPGSQSPVWLPCLPASHIGGLAVLLRSVFGYASLVWSEDEDLSRGPALGATHIAVVRTQLQRYDLTGYDAVLVGGAKPPMMRDTNTIATWGMTETGSGVVYDGYALPGVEMTILDGEFCVRTPTLFTKYRESDRPVRVDENGLEWFPTGDGGSIADGKLSISGRLQYVINTGGEKVWPEDLESLWSSIEGVRDVAAVGVDDPEWGQRIVALVVTDGRNVDEKLKGFAHEHIGPWAKPKEIRYVAALPRTSNGKIRRSELQHLF